MTSPRGRMHVSALQLPSVSPLSLVCPPISRLPFVGSPFTDPIAPLNPSTSRVDDDKNALHTILLELLQRQLEQEKHAHMRTKEEADAEISRLRALVARRDAELEACAIHSGHRTWLSSSVSGDPSIPGLRSTYPHSRRHPENTAAGPSRLSSVEAQATDGLVSQTLTRQRALEREVELLQEEVCRHGPWILLPSMLTGPQLQRTRLQRSRPLAYDAPTTSTVPLKPGHRNAGFEALPAPAARPTQSMSQNVPNLSRHPPSPHLRPQNLAGSPPSPYELTPAAGLERRQVHRNSISERPSRPAPVVAAEIASADTTVGMGELKQQIDLLAMEIEAFGAERDALKRMLADARGHQVCTESVL